MRGDILGGAAGQPGSGQDSSAPGFLNRTGAVQGALAGAAAGLALHVLHHGLEANLLAAGSTAAATATGAAAAAMVARIAPRRGGGASAWAAARLSWAAIFAFAFLALFFPALVAAPVIAGEGLREAAGHARAEAPLILLVAFASIGTLAALAPLPGERLRLDLLAFRLRRAGLAFGGAVVLGGLALAAGVELPSGAEAPGGPAALGEPVAVPGGLIRAEAAMPEQMAPMNATAFGSAGMSMSATVPDMTPEGFRRFIVDITVAAAPGRAFAFGAEHFLLVGEGMEPQEPLRYGLGEGKVLPGEMASGYLVFQVPEGAHNFLLSFKGASRPIAIDPGHAAPHSHGHGGGEAVATEGETVPWGEPAATAATAEHDSHHALTPAEFAWGLGRLPLLPVTAAVALAGFGPAFLLLIHRRPRRRHAPNPGRRRAAFGLAAVGFAVVAGMVAAAPPAPSQASSALPQLGPGCGPGTFVREYDVIAISLTIPFNRWGDVDANGMTYVLRQDKEAVRNWSLPLNADPNLDPAGNRRLRPRPLVLRANAGDCVKVAFTNELNPTPGGDIADNPRASIHVMGPSYAAQGSDGSMVGLNADSTVAIGQSITYFWRAPAEGLYLFRDQANSAGSEADGGSVSHGLYGALAVEPPGSTYRDPVSGQALYQVPPAGFNPATGCSGGSTPIYCRSGELYISADIIGPSTFRESIQLAQDEIPGVGFGFNYGSEPGGNRIDRRCPDCVGEETSLSSWTYGDPALVKLASGMTTHTFAGIDVTTGEPIFNVNVVAWLPADPVGNAENCGLAPTSCFTSNVTHTYRGDASKIRFGMAGVKETHVFHMHAHQWLSDPNDRGQSPPFDPNVVTPNRRPESITIDSQTFGPGEMFTADLLFGSGSRPRTIGDSIFHCHLYPHFADGFWALFRTHDVREDGTGHTPDGLLVANLEPLPAVPPPPAPTANNPGYPRFIPGEFGWRAPQPPAGISEPVDLAVPAVKAPAPRIVAGKNVNADPAFAARVAVEAAVQALNGGGKPGAPFTDPCPPGSREVTYNVSMIQRPVVYNEANWTDTQGRMLVLDADVAAIRSGAKAPEPFFFRVNAGDCINFNMTNQMPTYFGNDAFLVTNQTNMAGEHIHLVKFDVTGSDGSSNGWNYQEAAFTDEQVAFNRRVLAGTTACNAVFDTPTAKSPGCRVPMPGEGGFSPQFSWGANDNTVHPGQTIHERWFADYELRTVFTHDHHFPAIDQNHGLFGALLVEPPGFDVRNPVTGLYSPPINDPAHGSVCGASCVGMAAGTVVDMVGPGLGDDFREFALAIQDFVSLFDSGGSPLNPPAAPELFPDDDPGVMGLNYRNAPFLLRDAKNGVAVDPAYRFSSYVFGDPLTPVVQAYTTDPVRFRVIQGSQEEQHVLQVHGMRWRGEPDDPESPMLNARAIGVSEAFNFEAANFLCGDNDECRGDFLFGGTATDDLYLGAWGLLRVHGKRVPGLLPLPDDTRVMPGAGPAPFPTGNPPPMRLRAGNVCPALAPLRQFDVVAMEKDIVYNESGDHDPYGLMYVLAEDEMDVRNGIKRPEPLVIRANEGDCIEVNLQNKLTAGFLAHGGVADGDPKLPLEPPTGTRAGLRVSLHPSLVLYDVRYSDGATVGYNLDQTVGPGQSMLYRWYADDVNHGAFGGEAGAINLMDYGDLRGHRHHGLFAGLVIEPAGATYHHPTTGAEIRSGVAADIRVPGQPAFREFPVFFQDGLNLRDTLGVSLPDMVDHPPTPEEPIPAALDSEDQGEKGFNYANASFWRRLGVAPGEPLDGQSALNPGGVSATAMAHVFSSTVPNAQRPGCSPATPCDPMTPVFTAYAGDQIRMRVFQGGDKPRQHALAVAGHPWRRDPYDPGTETIGVQSGISVGRAFDLHMYAGGQDGNTGDYLFNCAVQFGHLSGGLWGIMRVLPYTGGVGTGPILPLQIDQVRVEVFEDRNGNGVRGPLELAQPGVTVQAWAGVNLVQSGVTGDDGSAVLSVPAGVYEIRTIAPLGMQLTTASPHMVTTSFNGSPVTALVGLRYPSNTWYFAEGWTGDGWQTHLYILNANPVPANVTVTYFQAAGAPVVKTFVIPAERRLTIFANDPAVGPGPGVAFGVVITSDQPITAHQSLTDTNGNLGHATTGSQVLSTEWYFAEGFTGNSWLTFISATNPGDLAADVTITYHKADGSSVSKVATVAPKSRHTFAGHADVPGSAFAVSLRSSQPIVAQEVLIDVPGLLAHGTMGSTVQAKTWYLAEGFTGDQWLTFISVGNLGTVEANVTATYNIVGGGTVSRSIVVPPGARGTFAAHDALTGVGSGQAFGVVVTSDAPVVVQQVLIDPKPGVALAHGAIGARTLSTEFTYGGGTSEAGWLTFVSVTNPGAAPVELVATAYFEDPAVAPVVRTLTLAGNSRTTFASFDGLTGVPPGQRYGVKVTASAPVISQEVIIDLNRYLAFGAVGTAPE